MPTIEHTISTRHLEAMFKWRCLNDKCGDIMWEKLPTGYGNGIYNCRGCHKTYEIYSGFEWNINKEVKIE